jgi:hypothetical protein
MKHMAFALLFSVFCLLTGLSTINSSQDNCYVEVSPSRVRIQINKCGCNSLVVGVVN